MIAVWLVGPPQRGGQGDNEFRIQTRGVSAGARSSAHKDQSGLSGRGTPGSGRPLSSAMDTVADVLQIGDAFGHQAAELR